MTAAETTTNSAIDSSEQDKRLRLLNKSRDITALQIERSLKKMIGKADDALFEMAKRGLPTRSRESISTPCVKCV